MRARRTTLRRTLSGMGLVLSVAASPLLGVAMPAPAKASIVEAIDFETLVKEADDVVLARVIKHKSQYDDFSRIVTDYEMQVERVEKGNSAPGAAIVVRQLGGTVGDRGMHISGEPGFSDGETVVVFGKRGQKAYLRPVGMGQGTMRVYEEAGVRMARSDAEGMHLVKRGDTTTKARAAMPAPRKLDDVLSDVHALVAAQK